MSLPAELSGLQGGGGGAEPESLEKQLTCPICLEIFNKPVVILPCQHNLCRKCANELYQPSLFQARTTMMVNSGRFRCPSCRHEVVLDRHGVYGLQRNLLVENIIDVYKQEVGSVVSSPAPLPPPPPAEERCSDHEAERVNIYCLTCQVPTCSLCKVFGAHQGCRVAPLQDVYRQRKDELNQGIDAVETFKNQIQAVIDQLEETCRTIEGTCGTKKQSVCEKFGRLFSILQERQKAMTQRISDEQDEKSAHILTLARCYGDRLEANRKLVETARSSMEEADASLFVQNSRELIARVRTASGSCHLDPPEPGLDRLQRYALNFSLQEETLRNVRFLSSQAAHEKVPEAVEPEPEREPGEPSPQNLTEQEQSEENSARDSVVQPDSQRAALPEEPVQIQSPGPDLEPVQTLSPGPDLEPVWTLSPPALGLMTDSVEAMRLETEDQDQDQDQDSEDVRSGRTKEERTEERGEEPEAVKDGTVCVDQDGMSTQQAVTLVFYLLAFLVLLQRVWAYLGCFICT